MTTSTPKQQILCILRKGYFMSTFGAELYRNLPIKHGPVSLSKISMVCHCFND